MSTPDLQQLALARAELDEGLNTVMTLLCPPPEGEPPLSAAEQRLVTAHLAKVKHALERFESAAGLGR